MTGIPDLKDVYKNAINGIEWDDETANHNMKKGETFTVGHEYGLSVFIEPEAGYKLDASDKDYSVTINGLNAIPIDGFSDERRGYYISYDCIGDIGAVNFLIVEPEVGSVPFFKGYAENGNVDWEVTELSYFDASTRRHLEAYDTFEEGHYYEIYFRMQAKDGYDFSIDMPGFEKKDISLTLEKGYLTVSAEKTEKDEDDKSYLRRERVSSYKRSYFVGDKINETDVKAKYDSGVLTLFVPKTKDLIPEKKNIAID